ncbi:MAG TPA: ATP-binding cassette domain-containing protein [Coriobacteriia bacterium]|nr:ATP-binding cassette domain-containing protein [Coriobacteriia bacterium]
MIQFQEVSFSYPGSPAGVRALVDVDLVISSGQMLAVLGANGSGKSTLARLTNGLLVPDAGRVLVDGMDTSDDSLGLPIRERVGMVFQHPDDQIVAPAVEDDVAFGPENLGMPRAEIRLRVDSAIADVGLTGLERREPHLLSGGQKQRLAIAGALAMNPRYLVLDEPTSMIDSQGKREVTEVLARLRASGHAVLLVTHDVAEAVRADRVAVIDAGRIVFQGTPEELLHRRTEFGAWGLEMPPGGVLAERLRALGRPIPVRAMDAESIGSSLWA